MTEETEIQQLEWLDDELAVGFVLVDGRRWRVHVIKNEFCKQCDGKGSYITDDLAFCDKNEYIEVEQCQECDGTGVVD